MKRALLIAINRYAEPQYNLRGCINDAKAWRAILTEMYDFSSEEIKVMHDDSATSENITTEIWNLLAGASNGDTCFLAFSGHGTQKGYRVEDEEDGKNEALVPYEMSYDSLITDDVIAKIFEDGLGGKDVHFSAVFDCCHSGTMTRELEYSENGTLEAKVVNRCIDISSIKDVLATPRSVGIGPYNAVSACRDEETAADLLSVDGSGVARGAFSYSLEQVLRDDPSIPILDLSGPVHDAIQRVSKHAQNPMYFARNREMPLLV